MDTIVVEQVIKVKPEQVWAALTNKDQMKNWYFDLKEFKPEIGFKFNFYGASNDKKYKHICEITEVEKNKKLSHTWIYEGFEGKSFITWEILTIGNIVQVKLTHTITEPFPANEASLDVENFVTGWNFILKTSLKNYLEK